MSIIDRSNFAELYTREREEGGGVDLVMLQISHGTVSH